MKKANQTKAIRICANCHRKIERNKKSDKCDKCNNKNQTRLTA